MKHRRGIKGVLHAEDGVPLAALSFKRASFDLALYRAMHHDLDMTNFGEGQPQRLLLPLLPLLLLGQANEVIAALWIGKGMVTAIGFEPGVAGSLAFTHAAKEVLHGLVVPFEHVLKHLRMDLLIVRTIFLDLWQLLGLHLIGDADATQAVGFAALFHACVVEFFAQT